jgi:tyrosinase
LLDTFAHLQSQSQSPRPVNMRFSSALPVLVGAVAVSARSIPESLEKREEFLPFTSFVHAVPFEEAQEAAANDPNFAATSDLTFNATESASDEVSTFRAPGCVNPFVRVEWRNMQPADRLSFVRAVRCLIDAPPSGVSPQARNRYEDLVWAHQQQASRIHGAVSFFMWHRYYVHVFSRMLREECGYAAPFPWWDETRDAGNFAASGLFTDQYFGTLPPANANGGTCVNNGAFAGMRVHIGPGGGFQDRCLARGENTGATRNVNRDYVNLCNQRTTWPDMRACAEPGPHAHGHNGIGPIMSDQAASPSDPIFFLHHAFVDRNLKVWQNQNSARWTSINGCGAPDTGNGCTPISLDTVLSSRGIRPDARVRDYLDTENAYLCYVYDYYN